MLVDELDPDEALDRVNQALKSYSPIEWWGMFGELVIGDWESPREVRSWFRDRKGRPTDPPPITGEGAAGLLGQTGQTGSAETCLSCAARKGRGWRPPSKAGP